MYKQYAAIENGLLISASKKICFGLKRCSFFKI